MNIRQDQIVADVLAERIRQERVHSDHNALDPLAWKYIGIIVEELGESSQALQYLLQNKDSVDTDELLTMLESYRSELIQVTASGVMVLERVGDLIEKIALGD